MRPSAWSALSDQRLAARYSAVCRLESDYGLMVVSNGTNPISSITFLTLLMNFTLLFLLCTPLFFSCRSLLLPVFLGDCSTAPPAPVHLPEEATTLQGTTAPFLLLERLRPTSYWPATSVKGRLAEYVRFAPQEGGLHVAGITSVISADYMWKMCHQI